MTQRTSRPSGRRRSLTFIGTVGVFVFGFSAAASAYFTSGGTGSGTGSTGTMTIQVTALQAGDTPSTTLLPGGSADVIARVTNPNSFDVAFVSAVLDTSGAGISTNNSNCAPSNFGFTAQSTASVMTLAHNATSVLHFPAAATLLASAPQACQGVTVTIPLTVTVKK